MAEPAQTEKPLRYIRLPEVIDRSGFKTAYIYKLMASGEFPKAHKIGKRAVAWYEHEIEEWQRSRAERH